MPRPPFLPLKAAWIKASERSGREGGPKSGPLRPFFIRRTINCFLCREGGPKSGPLRLFFICSYCLQHVGKVGRSQAR